MADEGRPNQTLRAAVAALILSGALPLTACGTRSYAGISLAPDAADPVLHGLAVRASTGNRAAMYALADRLERGDGVARNLTRARLLYAEIAVAHGGSWLPPSAKYNRSAPIHAGATEDDLARAARVRLEALARPSELRLRWIVAKGIFDALDDSDEAGNAEAARACDALAGEFAPLIEPRPLPGCGFKGFRRRGSDRVYTAVTYNESEEGSVDHNNDDAMVTSRLSIWPIPNPGDCGVYNAVEFIRGREVVATILVSERQPRDKNCHSRVQARDPDISIK